MSENCSNFVTVNQDMELKLAYVKIAQQSDEIAQMRSELAKANEKPQTGISEEFLHAELERVSKYYEERLKAMEEILNRTNQENKRQTETFMRTIESMQETICSLNASLEASRISEAEMKVLERLRRSQRFAPTSEQRRLLNNRKQKGRDEEKDNFMDEGGNLHGNGTDCTAATEAEKASERPSKKQKDGRSFRFSYKKNIPYTKEPIYHMLDEYYELPENGTYVMRDGKIDTWWYRELKRIPEHYEEHFYEVASVYIKGKGKVLTKENTRIIKGCPFDLDLICFILTEHFSYNTPFTRIVEKLHDKGLNMSNQTLGVQVHKVISFIRKNMAGVWEQQIRKAHNWMLDETPGIVGVVKDGIKSYVKRYFWAIKANVMKLVMFIYEGGSRGLKAIRSFLDEFIGFFTTDGYVVYKVYEDDALHPNQHRSSCLTHIRRYFVEALNENREIAEWFINEIARLFAIEYECKKLNLDAEGRRRKRLKESYPIMKRIEQEFERYAAAGYKNIGTLTKRALKYIKKEWGAMKTILQDGNLEISNNLAEQMMRHIKMNLKNCLNIGSEESAKDYAFMFSMIESCKMNDLPFGVYLRHLIPAMQQEGTDKTTLLPCFYTQK